MNIQDIPLSDIIKFLDINRKKYGNNDVYDIAFSLMQNNNTIYKGVPKSIIEWMKAYNLVQNNVSSNIPSYSVYEIERMSDGKLSSLARLLTMKTTNIKSIISILDFLHKIDNSETIPILPNETIREIASYVNNPTLSSLLTVNKQNSTLASGYKDKIFLAGIERELRHVPKFFPKFDLKIGDRVIVANRNFMVTFVNEDNTEATIDHVDTLGNIIEDDFIKIYKNTPKPWKQSTGYEWLTGKDYGTPVSPGILLRDLGPYITDLNSPYLKYDTYPSDTPRDQRIPKLNMLVSVVKNHNGRGTYNIYYVITKLSKDHMTLEHVFGGDNVVNTLEAKKSKKFKNTWKIVNDDNASTSYQLYNIGSFQL
jgi:hypothetical protein